MNINIIEHEISLNLNNISLISLKYLFFEKALNRLQNQGNLYTSYCQKQSPDYILLSKDTKMIAVFKLGYLKITKGVKLMPEVIGNKWHESFKNNTLKILLKLFDKNIITFVYVYGTN